LALTPGLIANIFKRPREGESDDDLLPDPALLLEGKGGETGGYVKIEGDWWIPSGRAFFDANADQIDPGTTSNEELEAARPHFFVPRLVVDPFGQATTVDYAHDLLVASTTDALGNEVSADNDYRVLRPNVNTDPNGNRVAAAFDALGMVVATALMGKEGENVGDELGDVTSDVTQNGLLEFVGAPP